ncbi:hypothetical protein [Jiulongibacter sediminis]|nr:hypothetical protein [Jiulongibacter sediminis]
MHRLAILLLFLASCNSSESSTNSITEQTENTIEMEAPEKIEEKKLPLESFTVEEFPKEINGCACYYWLPDQSEKFIYVDDYARTAFVKIKGHFEEMEIYDVYADGDVIQQKCRGEHWGLTVDLKKVSQMDETSQYAGTLEIDGIDGTSQTLDVKGECGC